MSDFFEITLSRQENVQTSLFTTPFPSGLVSSLVPMDVPPAATARSEDSIGAGDFPRGCRQSSGGWARMDCRTVSQMRTVESPDAEASRVPSGLKATAWT